MSPAGNGGGRGVHTAAFVPHSLSDRARMKNTYSKHTHNTHNYSHTPLSKSQLHSMGMGLVFLVNDQARL